MRQGDPICPKLFTAEFRRSTLENAKLEEKGIDVDGEKLLDPKLADDAALTIGGVTDMEHHLNIVTEESLTIGLIMHKGKADI